MELKTYFAQDAAGNLTPGATVTIYQYGTTNIATGLTKADGTPLSNPFSADSAGRIQFKAPDGFYDMRVNVGSGTAQTVTIQCVDYSEAKAAADQALAALKEIQSIVANSNGFYHVDSFGAVGDWNGTTGTDDSAAFNAAFAAAHAAGGGKVVADGGKRYRTTYTVFYGDNTVFDGQGCEVFYDVNAADGSAFMPVAYNSYTDFTYDITFMNFTLNGPTGRGNGIGANRARRLMMFNVGSKYLHWHLFDGAGAQQVKIINCWSEGTQTAVFQADNAAYNKASWANDAAGNVLPISFDTTGVGGWSNCRDMLVYGCTARNARYACVHLHNNNNQNIKVVDCFFENSAAGVFADAGDNFLQHNVLISGTSFVRCTRPINWGSGWDVLKIHDVNIYGENTTDWYYGVYLSTAHGIRRNLMINGLSVKGFYRPIYIVGAFGINIDTISLQDCGGTTAPNTELSVSGENPLSMIRLSGCKTGSVSNVVAQDCLTPVVISVARDERDSTYSTGIHLSDNVSRGSGCLYSLYYADRCSISDSEYVGLGSDFFGLFAANSIGLVVDGMYITQGTGKGMYFDGCTRPVLRDSTLFSSGTDLAVTFNNCAAVKTSRTIVTGGYDTTHINLAGNTTAMCDEPFSTIGKSGTASGTKVTYETSAI